MSNNGNTIGGANGRPSRNSTQSRRSTGFTRAKSYRPCPICGRKDWCEWTDDEVKIICMRGDGSHPDYERTDVRRNKVGEQYYVYTRKGSARSRSSLGSAPASFLPPDVASGKREPEERPDVSAQADMYERQARAEPDCYAKLIIRWRLGDWVVKYLPLIGVGWVVPWGMYAAAWTFRERDPAGRTVGISKLFADPGGHPVTGESKGFVPGTKHGIITPVGVVDGLDCNWRKRAIELGFLLLVEGVSDVVACLAAGLPVLGRPSNRAGVPDLAEMLKDLPPHVQIIFVGERDLKEDRRWPGNIGAYDSARVLRELIGRTTFYAHLPPRAGGVTHKDIRDWLIAETGPGSQGKRWENVGIDLAAQLRELAIPAPLTEQIRTLADELAEESFVIRSCERPYVMCFCKDNRSAQPGAHAVGTLRCKSWSCGGCHDKKAKEHFVNTSIRFQEYVTTDCVNPEAKTGQLGNLAEHGPWVPYWGVFPTAERVNIAKRINKLGGQYSRVETYVAVETLSTVATASDSTGEVPPILPHPLFSCRVPANTGVAGSQATETEQSPQIPKELPPPVLDLFCAVFPPATVPPPGFEPATPVGWLAIHCQALVFTPYQPQEGEQRLRPVYCSPGFRLVKEEKPGGVIPRGPTAFTQKVIREQIVFPLDASRETFLVIDDLECPPTGFDVRSPILNWTLCQLILKKNHEQQPHTTQEVVTAFRKWAPTLAGLNAKLMAGATPDDPFAPGSEVARLILLYLWQGAPPDFTADLLAASEADRVEAVELSRRLETAREGDEMLRAAEKQWRADPGGCPPIFHTLFGQPE